MRSHGPKLERVRVQQKLGLLGVECTGAHLRVENLWLEFGKVEGFVGVFVDGLGTRV